MLKSYYGCYDTKSGSLVSEYKNVYEYSSAKCELYVIGSVWISDRTLVNDGAEIETMFLLKKESFNECLKGIYILIAYSKEDKKLYIYQDMHTSPLSLYYVRVNDKIHISTSLKSLLIKSQVQRCLNTDVIEEFINNGFVWGERTLLQNVFKLKFYHSLFIHFSVLQQYKVFYPIERMHEDVAKQKWGDTLEQAVLSCLPPKDGSDRLSIPLSNGYDTNYIFSVINKYRSSDEIIHAICIGGKNGVNEINDVMKNISHFSNVDLHTDVVENKLLESYPDIVWRLEGSMFEKGIFLQYLLANTSAKNEYSVLVCGEGANEVMMGNYYDEEFMYPFEEKRFHYHPDVNKYLFLSAVILKKNGTMANSFGYESRFPFLDYDFVNLAASLTAVNRRNKLFHKAFCKDVFHEEVYRNVLEQGGTTDGHALFDNRRELRRFFRIVENCDFVMENHQYFETVVQKSLISEAKRGVKHIYGRLFRSEEASFEKRYWWSDEEKIRKYLTILYLDVFCKLFVSGQYDERMSDDGIDVTLSSILRIDNAG